MIYFKLLEKQEQTKHKTSRWRETIKVRAEINEIENKQTIQRINETKSWFFEKIIKIDKPFANMKNGGRKRPKLIKSEMKKGT
jgi:hypothetical protein